MIKVIDLSRSIHDLSKDYPEVPEILYEIGFQDIIKPGMLSTVGRFMTLPKGAAAKKIDMEIIRKAFRDRGFEIN
ncbi:MAG: hypothetical protein K0S47_925 [Herbinix sp.]|nr:hypothetical protein [Herbinix sp.]